MNRNNIVENETRIKIFQIQNESDEAALNAFLVGKAVRHWEVNFTPSSSLPSADGTPLVLGVWNVFVAYNERDHERESESHNHDQQNRSGRTAPPLSKKYPGSREHTSASAEKRSEARKPIETYKPDVATQDFPLFESIRTWRNSRAREERVKPFSFFNNRQLEEIVTAKPADASSLKGLAIDMEPQLWEKYHKELLGFIDAARFAKTETPSAGPSAAESSAAEAVAVEPARNEAI